MISGVVFPMLHQCPDPRHHLFAALHAKTDSREEDYKSTTLLLLTTIHRSPADYTGTLGVEFTQNGRRILDISTVQAGITSEPSHTRPPLL